MCQDCKESDKIFSDGFAYFWDGNFLEIIPYEGNRKHYYCGKRLDKSLLNVKQTKLNLVCIMDSKERIIALVWKDGYKVLDHDHSGISGKHGSGGQSAARFERQRGELVKQWLKQTADIINTRLRQGITGELLIGGPAQTKNKMSEFIDTTFQKDIKFISAEYCNLAGVIQLQRLNYV